MQLIIQINLPQVQIICTIEGISGARETKHVANFSFASECFDATQAHTFMTKFKVNFDIIPSKGSKNNKI